MRQINNAYVSDKYQYTMGKSYLDCGKKDQIAVFNLFYRQAPENNNWAVVSGTEEVIEMVQALADVVSLLIAIPVGLSEIRKLERLRDTENAVM